MTDIPAHDASHIRRHETPQDLRDSTARLHSLISRYVKAMGRPWTTDEAATSSAGLLLEIAREALQTQERHAKWIATEVWPG